MADETEEERKRRRDADLAYRDQNYGPLPLPQPDGPGFQQTDSGDTAPSPDEVPKGYANSPALTPDLSGAQPSQQASYPPPPAQAETPTQGYAAQPPGAPGPQAPPPQSAPAQPGPAYTSDNGDGSGLSLRPFGMNGPMPAYGSPRHRAEEMADRPYNRRTGESANDAADRIEREITPPPGYQRSALPGAHSGVFDAIPGGPADTSGQPQVPIDPRTGYPQGMAMLRTANGMSLMPDTPDNRLADLQHSINLTQLSQPEQMQAQSLRQNLAQIQQAMQRGDLSREDGARLTQQVQQMGQDLWARQGSLPEMMEKQRYLMMQKEAAHQQAILTQNEQHAAATAQGRLPTASATLPDGRQIHFVQSSPGHWTAVTPEPREHNTEGSQTPEQKAHAAMLHEMDAQLHAEETAAARAKGPNETDEEYERRRYGRGGWMNRGSPGPLSARQNELLSRVNERRELQGLPRLTSAQLLQQGNSSGAGTPTNNTPAGTAGGNPTPTNNTPGPRDQNPIPPLAQLRENLRTQPEAGMSPQMVAARQQIRVWADRIHANDTSPEVDRQHRDWQQAAERARAAGVPPPPMPPRVAESLELAAKIRDLWNRRDIPQPPGPSIFQRAYEFIRPGLEQGPMS